MPVNIVSVLKGFPRVLRILDSLKKDSDTFSQEINDLKSVSIPDLGSISQSFKAFEVPMVILAGQSNMDGRGNLTDLPGLNTTFNGEVRVYDKPLVRTPANASINRQLDGVWKDYEVGDMVVEPNGAAATAFGPELAIALRWRDEVFPITGQVLHIVKAAIGGSSLADNGTVDTSWADTEESLRQVMRDFIIFPAIKDLQQEGKTPYCIGYIWGQGENDGQNIDKANAYLTNLNNFIPEHRRELHFPDCRTLIMGLSPVFDGTEAWDTVKSAQASFCNGDDNSILIPTDGSGSSFEISRYISGASAGPLHYSSLGLMQLGGLYFDNLDFNGTKLVEYWEFTFIANSKEVTPVLNDDDIFIYENAVEGFQPMAAPEVLQFPTNSGHFKALAFVRSGEMVGDTLGSQPVSIMEFTSVGQVTDCEIVFRMAHDGSSSSRPGFYIRSEDLNKVNNFTPCYLVQVRTGGSQITVFRGNATSFTSVTGSPINITSPLPATSEPFWYKITLVGTTLIISNSPDGKTFTQQGVLTDSGITGPGKIIFVNFGDTINKSIGDLKTSNYAMSDILIRSLD